MREVAIRAPRGYTVAMDDSRATLIIHIATLGGFKIVTSILILYFFPSWEALVVVLGLSVPWIVAAIWYFGVYSRVHLRLVRVRARRKELVRQEWNVD